MHTNIGVHPEREYVVPTRGLEIIIYVLLLVILLFPLQRKGEKDDTRTIYFVYVSL